MREQIDKMWTQLKGYFSKMSKANKVRLAILSAIIIILAIVAVSMISHTHFVLLIVAQDYAEAGQVQTAIREIGVPMQIDGLRIFVPEERASELRATLSLQGVIGPGTRDLGIMSRAEGFAVTDAHARELYDHQLSEDIRMAILQSPRIQNAIVIVRQGETSPFRAAHGVRAPHAAIMLTIRGGERLSNMEAQAIADYIRGAVPGIGFENIHITDSNFNSYRVGEQLTIDAESEMAMRITIQNVLTEQIRTTAEQMLMPIFGVKNIRITPYVSLNWDRVAQEVVEFAPPVAGELQGMFRSALSTWEAARGDDLAMGIPGTDSNELGAAEYPFGTLEDGALYERRVSERNYELNQTTTVIERAQGSVESVSIAVLLNSEAIEGDFATEVANLVSFGFGIPAARVTVQSVPFGYVDTALEEMYEQWQALQAQQRTRELISTIIQYVLIVLIGVMVLLLVRIIVRAIKPPEPEPLLAVASGLEYIVDDEEDDNDSDDEIQPIEDVVEYDDFKLQTKTVGLEQIERFIDKDPAAVAQLLRNWLTDE
ncbi:MAG: hypothetical protein FWC66_00850 [Oscillospiraceae bacterium]|nr:hypothetical protein [Oscillospiraceae bacterium]